MISKIGNPDPGTDVHFYRSASPDGTREEGTMAFTGCEGATMNSEHGQPNTPVECFVIVPFSRRGIIFKNLS